MAVSIPIAMGYAQIAGLPAVYGLYGSIFPILIFALCSTSPQFIFGVDAAPEIQFMLAFRVAGTSCIPARIHSFALLYETDEALPSGFRWNLGDSNQSNGTLGMVQTSLLPALGVLTITYYRADTDQAVLVQSSGDSEFGVWEFYNEGFGSWVAGVGSNAVGVRRRFVPSAGLPVGVDLYAKMTIE